MCGLLCFNARSLARVLATGVTLIYFLLTSKHLGEMDMMKKTLLASAVLMASGAALAQSSVTLYGVADLGVGKMAGGKTQMQGNTFINNSVSHLGFRGVEDLGGGLKAGFNFEHAINLENGENVGAWGRAANVWLGGNWGRLQLGKATPPSYNAMRTWDLMGLPLYSPAFFSFGYVGGDSVDRQSSQISYKTPVWGGFSAEAAYVMKADNNDKAKVDVALTYVNGPLSAGIAVNKTKNNKTNYGLGAKYNFGTFTLAASYQDTRNWTYANPGARGRISGLTLGGMAQFGAFSVALDVLRELTHDIDLDGVTYKRKKYTNGAVELKYALSKRTFFYGVYLRNAGDNNYNIGMQHRF